MKKTASFLIVFLVFLLFGSSGVLAIDKIKIGSAIREYPGYYLPILAAEEKGFWKNNGLEVEWIPFKGSPLLAAGMAAGDVKVGIDGTTSVLQAASRALPVIIVSDFQTENDFTLYVRAGSPIKEPIDLKGTKIGVTRLGVISHCFGILIAKKFGIEKDVKFIGTGGTPETAAALRTGVIDATVLPVSQFAEIVLKGEFRQVTRAADYLPKEWLMMVVFAHKDFVKERPDVVRRTIKALMEAIDFINKNPLWAIEKMKTESGFSEEAARLVHKTIVFTKDGRINRKAVENVLNFLVEFGIITKEKAPEVDKLFTTEFTR
jgi:NitT/TauT family transport system substrate-binding protein